MRKVWYSFRWVCDETASRRVNRIWDRGHIEEGRIITDLDRVGCTITDQEFEVVGITGHARGHGDGKAIGVPTQDPEKKHLFEAKTMANKYYLKFLKEGLQRYSSTYWQQIHSYMGHEKLPACLYVVVNKDTEDRDYQIIDFDKAQFQEGERIAFNIVTAEVPPPKLANASKNFFECKHLCSFTDVCHRNKTVDRNCRTCVYWNIEEAGRFSCELADKELNKEEQLEGCHNYSLDEATYCV